MQCPECHSAHIRKNGKKRGKKITFASAVVANSSTTMICRKVTQMNSNENASKCTSTGQDFG